MAAVFVILFNWFRRGDTLLSLGPRLWFNGRSFIQEEHHHHSHNDDLAANARHLKR